MGMRQGDRGEGGRALGYGIQDPRFGAYGHDAGVGGHGAAHYRNRYPDGSTVGSADHMYSQHSSSQAPSSSYSSSAQSHSGQTSLNPSDAARYRQQQMLQVQQHQQHQPNYFDRQQQQLDYQQQEQRHRHHQQQQLSTRDGYYQLQLAGRSDTAASRSAVCAAQRTHPGGITAPQDEDIESDEMRDSDDEDGDEDEDQGGAEERNSNNKSSGLQQSKHVPASGESVFRMGAESGSGQGPGPRAMGVLRPPVCVPGSVSVSEASVLVTESPFMDGDFSFM
jgi:hypothetical protein